MKQLSALLLILLSFGASALDEVRVRLFSDSQVSVALTRVLKGQYVWVAYSQDEKVIDTVAMAGRNLRQLYDVRSSGNDLAITREALSLGHYHMLKLVPLSDSSHFLIKGNGPERIYNGTLEIRRVGQLLQLINVVKIDDYIAGVVESEGGHFVEPDYFKAQAVIARTWLISNLKKHIAEGYNVKDDVSSQVYKGIARLQNSQVILASVHATGDTVVVDESNKPILGVFHANSGGQTANSQDAWSGRIAYLQSVSDTFSLHGEKAFWEKQISKEEFVSYVARQLGVSASDANFRLVLLGYQPEGREGVFEYAGKSMKWRVVRSHFRLRSSWFSVTEVGDKVLLKGRGFGHGVGMSQEGANEMARRGYNWKQILSHYYNGTSMVSSGTL